MSPGMTAQQIGKNIKSKGNINDKTRKKKKKHETLSPATHSAQAHLTRIPTRVHGGSLSASSHARRTFRSDVCVHDGFHTCSSATSSHSTSCTPTRSASSRGPRPPLGRRPKRHPRQSRKQSPQMVLSLRYPRSRQSVERRARQQRQT